MAEGLGFIMSNGLRPRPMKNPNARAMMKATIPTRTNVTVSLGTSDIPPLLMDNEVIALFR